jgi:hypothetical protein
MLNAQQIERLQAIAFSDERERAGGPSRSDLTRGAKTQACKFLARNALLRAQQQGCERCGRKATRYTSRCILGHYRAMCPHCAGVMDLPTVAAARAADIRERERQAELKAMLRQITGRQSSTATRQAHLMTEQEQRERTLVGLHRPAWQPWT